MINYETANLKDLFLELKETKKYLNKAFKKIEITYKKTRRKLNKDSKALALLSYYYEGHSINKVLTDAKDIFKIIDSILQDPVVSKNYIKQLKDVARTDRSTGLSDYKHDWLEKIDSQDYSNIYIEASHMNKWLDDCVNIANNLETFVGEKNLLIRTPKHTTETIGLDAGYEEINLRTLSLKIKGNRISRGNMSFKKVFNPTETKLIYFLYLRSQKNKEECFSLKILALELKSTEGYLKNSITGINKKIRKVMSDGGIKCELLITNETKRGYRINHRLKL